MKKFFPTVKFIVCIAVLTIAMLVGKWAVDSCLPFDDHGKLFPVGTAPDFVCSRVVSIDSRAQKDLSAFRQNEVWRTGSDSSRSVPKILVEMTYFTQVLWRPTTVLKHVPSKITAIGQVLLLILFASLIFSLLWEIVGFLILNSINAYDERLLEKSRRLTATYQVLFPESYRPEKRSKSTDDSGAT